MAVLVFLHLVCFGLTSVYGFISRSHLGFGYLVGELKALLNDGLFERVHDLS